MTYLLIRLTSLGNVAMLAPVVASLSKNYPTDEFIILCQKPLQAMFYGMNNVRVISTSTQKDAVLPDIDVVIDLQGSWRTKWMTLPYLFRRKKTFTIASEKRGRNRWGHESERYIEVFERAGLHADKSFTALAVNKQAREEVLKRYKITDENGRFIGIAPFAKHKTNRIPYRVTKELISHFSAQPDTRVFLFGAGKVEETWLGQWARLFPRVESVAGVLPLEQELELMRQLDVMFCMDSANQHLASLVGLRAISVWCGTHPKNGFYGFKQSLNDCVQKDNVRCRPCTLHGKEHCKYGNYLCKEITAEEISRKYE